MKTLACFVATSAVLACTVNTTDNFQNPPPPPPATCTVDTTVAGCTAGSVGYACTSDRPDDGDTNLVCSAGTAGPGTTLYCCLPYGQYFTECTTDTNIPGCANPAFGFLCSGQTTPGVDAGPTSPADADSNLACSAGIASGTGFAYCCVSSEVPATCVATPDLACVGASVGFSCAGNDSPGENDAPVACSVGTSGEAGTTTRCCIPFAQSPTGCEEDQTVTGCEPGSYGFSCAGLAVPQTWNSALTCTPGTAASTFCCTFE